MMRPPCDRCDEPAEVGSALCRECSWELLGEEAPPEDGPDA